MSFQHLLSDRTQVMGENAIREILKVVSQPGMISLAGGIPAPESFPMDIMTRLTTSVIEKYGASAFQYDLTEGFMPLRQALVGLLTKRGIEATAQQIIIGSGSQGFLDGIGKTLISKGEPIAVEAPTYLGAISAFNPYEPEYIRMDTDDQGLIPASLEWTLKTFPVKLVYLTPTFQNPTGRTIPMDRRIEIARIITKHNALLVEDDPYSMLRYRGEELAPIKTLAPDHVMYISTLSKVLAPGIRIGFCVAPDLIRTWLVLAKQGVDLHTSTFNQAMAAEYLTQGHLEHHLPAIINLYRPRQEAMLLALKHCFPERFQWSKPEGGMFLWVEGPKGLNMESVYYRAIERKTAFVPGRFFYTQKNEGLETMRLNYTMYNEQDINKAVSRLSDVVREFTR